MINIRIAETNEDKNIANKIVIDFHSYVSSPRTVGRCIKYLISYNTKDVATFWLGSGFKPTPKAILNFFKVSQKEFDKMFNEVADNKRFCIKENPIPNFGSQILSRIRKRATTDWFNKYGNNLKGILLTSTTAFFWGILAIALKVSVKYVDTLSIVWLRFFIAYLILTR